MLARVLLGLGVRLSKSPPSKKATWSEYAFWLKNTQKQFRTTAAAGVEIFTRESFQDVVRGKVVTRMRGTVPGARINEFASNSNNCLRFLAQRFRGDTGFPKSLVIGGERTIPLQIAGQLLRELLRLQAISSQAVPRQP